MICFDHRKVKGVSRAAIFSRKRITAGTELTFDYQWDRKRGRATTKCFCNSPSCRGTLEVPNQQDGEEEARMQGHWKIPKPDEQGESLINRIVKVYFFGNQEYFVAKVTKFRPDDNHHFLTWQPDGDESWEDLSKDDWMILDEEAEEFVIRRKTTDNTPGASPRETPSIQSEHFSATINSDPSNEPRNVLWVESTVKEILNAKRIIQKAEHSFRVTVTMTRSSREEDISVVGPCDGPEKFWKLIIEGLHPSKAIAYLKKNIEATTTKVGGEDSRFSNRSDSQASPSVKAYIAIPRQIAEKFKQISTSSRVKFRDVNFSSFGLIGESKCIDLVELSGPAESVDSIKCDLWDQLQPQSIDPKPGSGSKEGALGFRAALMDQQFLNILWNCDISIKAVSSHELTTESPFFSDFEKSQGCHLKIIKENNNPSGASAKTSTRETKDAAYTLYISAHPSRVQQLWDLIRQRGEQLQQGVRFLFKDYHTALVSHVIKFSKGKPNSFTEYIKKATEVDISVDATITKGWIVLDGRSSARRGSADDNMALAEKLLRLQLLSTRNAVDRERQYWFGRDWYALLELLDTKDESNLNQVIGRTSIPLIHSEEVYITLCKELAELNSSLQLPPGIAAHACVILYRCIVLSRAGVNFTFSKPREIALACLFIANKSQRVVKWKGLDEILKVAMSIFHPESPFSVNSDEAKSKEQQILSAESFIVNALAFDVFWTGMDWMVSIAVNKAGMSRPLLENAVACCHTGSILAAGPGLWLKFGPACVFAAVAGLMSVDITPLILALQLKPSDVSCAASLIVRFIESQDNHEGGSRSKKRRDRSKTTLSPGIQSTMISGLAHIVGHCEAMQRSFQSNENNGRISNLARVFLNVDPVVAMEKIIPVLPRMESECNCCIQVENLESVPGEKCNILLEGGWRGVSKAQSELLNILNERFSNIEEVDISQVSRVRRALWQELRLVISKSPPQDRRFRLEDIALAEGEAKNKNIIRGYASNRTLSSSGVGFTTSSPLKSSTGIISDSFFAQEKLMQGRQSHNETLCELYESLFLSDDDSKGQTESIYNPLPVRTGSTMTSGGELLKKVALKRWPSKKAESKEIIRTSQESMSMGFSASALQEFQILYQFHIKESGSTGHPNIVFPLAIGSPTESNNKKISSESSSSDLFSLAKNSVLSLPLSNYLMGEPTTTKSASSVADQRPYILLDYSPLALQDVLTRRKRNSQIDMRHDIITPVIFASWFHDILSACETCHENNIILRMIKPDQISLGEDGVARFAEFSGAVASTFQSSEESRKNINFRKAKRDVGSDIYDPYQAPEILLGSIEFTRESDMWSIGAMMAALLLGKPLFTGRDRSTFLAGIFKVCGSPSPKNFPEAKTSYYYEKAKSMCSKNYKPGVQKALCHLIGDESLEQDYSDAIDLIASILRLDPAERITATGALSHKFMLKHRDFIRNEKLNHSLSFAKDWENARSTLGFPSTLRLSEKNTAFQNTFSLPLQNSAKKSADSDVRNGSGQPHLKRLKTSF